jgi:PelA/Pel-15E family pectate lyase
MAEVLPIIRARAALVLAAAAALSATLLGAPGPPVSQSVPAIAWKDCLSQAPAWYSGPEAVRVADNVVVYQRRDGGWPKNIDMAAPMSPAARATVTDDRELNDSTIDNGSTYGQLRFLALVIDATRGERFRAPFFAGLDYLFKAQYPNGGWPQYYPLRTDYSRYITFNDGAMIGVMTLLRDVSAGKAPFRFVDEARRRRAQTAIEAGLDVILRSQIKAGRRLTAWCAQVDPVTLEPRGARSYEHPSTSGKESVDIVRYLLAFSRPTPAVVDAIEGAVAFLRENRVTGIRLVTKPDPTLPNGRDVVAVADSEAPLLWARFYELGTNRPIFSGRDGVVKYSLAEIEPERRAGYSWLGPYAADLIEKEYPAWRQRIR